MLREKGWRRVVGCMAAALLLASQQAKPCDAQQIQYSPGRGGTAYTPTALAAIDKAAPAPAPAAGKDGAAGGSARPEPPAPDGGGGNSPGGPPPYTVLAAIIVGAGLCISVVACLCVRRLAMITHTRRLAQATDVLEERRRRAIAMTELSRQSLSTKPLAPVHVVIMPDASISFAVELNTAGEFVSTDLAVEGAAADVAAAAVAGQLGNEAEDDDAAEGVGTDAAVFAEDIADAEHGGITITRLRVHRSASSASYGSQRRRRPPAAGSPGGRPQSASPLAQYLAWEAIRVEIEHGNVPSRGNMLLLGSLAPPPGHHASDDPAAAAAAAAAAASAGASAAAAAAAAAASEAAAAATTESGAADVSSGQVQAAAQPSPAQGWMAAARDSLARGSSRLMYGSSGDLTQAAALERASSQSLQRNSAAGGPPARSRSGGRLPRISGSAHGGTGGGTGGVPSSAGSGGSPAGQGGGGGNILSGGGDAALGPASSNGSGLPRSGSDTLARTLSGDHGGRGGTADPVSVFTGEALISAGPATASASDRVGQPQQQDGTAARPTAGQLTTAHATTAGHGPQGSGSVVGNSNRAGAGDSGSSTQDPMHQLAAPTEPSTPPQHPGRPGSPPPSTQRGASGPSLPDSGAGGPVTARKSQSGELRQKFGLAGDEG